MQVSLYPVSLPGMKAHAGDRCHRITVSGWTIIIGLRQSWQTRRNGIPTMQSWFFSARRFSTTAQHLELMEQGNVLEENRFASA